MSVLASHLVTTVPIFGFFAFILCPRRIQEGDPQ